VDKIIFWLSPGAMRISDVLRFHPQYDSAVFFAYLTIIPALSLFLIQIETDFYISYRNFYSAVCNRSPYSLIKKRKEEMGESLRRSIGILLRYQGLLSILAITFAPELSRFFQLPWVNVPIFRILVLGSFLHSLLLILMILVLYFDFKKQALFICVFFLITNAIFTYITTLMDTPFYGYGYLFSTFLTLLVGFYTFDASFKNLEYRTFALQPVGVHRQEEIL